MAETLNLQGSIVNIYAPAPLFRYELDVSKLRWGAELRDLINDLREWVRTTDEKYAEKKTRGRNLKVKVKPKRTKTGSFEDREIRVIEVPIVPSRVESILGMMRGEIYDALRELCPSVEKIDIGRKKRRIYFLPNSRINDFVERVHDANERINEANRVLNQFKESEDLAKLNRILIGYGYSKLPEIPRIKPLRFSLMPVVMDYSVVYEYVDQKYRNEIEAAIMEEKERIVNAAMEKILQEIRKIVSMAENNAQIDLSVIDRTEKLAKDVGLYEYIKEYFIDLRESITASVEEVRKHRLQQVSQIKNERLKALMRELVA